MKLYLDENLSPRIAEILRASGFDAASAHEVGNLGLADQAQLRHAARQGRALVTLDVGDFVGLATEALRQNEHHGGIILVPSVWRRAGAGALATALGELGTLYPQGLAGVVVFASRRGSAEYSGTHDRRRDPEGAEGAAGPA